MLQNLFFMKKTALLIILIFTTTIILSQEKRLALIIGNSLYEHGSSLKNPVNDAELMSNVLSELDFEVILKTNSTKIDMDTTILNFWRKLDKYDVALFYYAGHGIQVEGVNYLLPVDAVLEDKLALQIEAVDVEKIVKQFEHFSDNINIVILDACRDNPYRSWMRGSGNGFSAPKAPSGTLIAYATSAGATASDGLGDNGLYTEQLAKELKIPQRIEDVFINTRNAVRKITKGRQNPQEWSQLTGQFKFAESKAPPSIPMAYVKVGSEIIWDANLSLSQVVLLNEIYASANSSEDQAKYIVTGFTVSVTVNGGFNRSVSSPSNKFTAEQKSLIRSMRNGQNIIIKNIKCRGADGETYLLNPIVLSLK